MLVFPAFPQALCYGIPPLFLIVGIVTLLNQVRFGRRAVAAIGEVIDLHYKSRTYHPVVRFQYMDEERGDEEVDFWSSYGSRPPSNQVGNRVPVLYDPEYPKHAQINTFGARWFLPCVCIFAGIVCSFVFLIFPFFLVLPPP